MREIMDHVHRGMDDFCTVLGGITVLKEIPIGNAVSDQSVSEMQIDMITKYETSQSLEKITKWCHTTITMIIIKLNKYYQYNS